MESTVNATLEAIERRYACRAFAPTPVPADTLRAVAVAGLHAPSAMNRQPWRLVAVSDSSLLADLERAGMAALKDRGDGAYERILGRGGQLLYGAPAAVIVAQEPIGGPFPAALDVGIVASHLTIAATSLGLDSCVVALVAGALEGPEGPGLKVRLGFPDGWEFGIAVLVGHAASGPGTPHPADLAKLVERY
jgi:nitroreductase